MQKTQPSIPMHENNDLFLQVINDSLEIETHYDLLIWLQGQIQQFLPHEILISAWGDFSLGLIYFDIVSTHPLIRTKNISENTLTPQIIKLFNEWIHNDKSPKISNFNESVFNLKTLFKDEGSLYKLSNFNFQAMKSVMIHGIKDNRGSHDCLYILMHKSIIPENAKQKMMTIMPFIDCAFRRIDQLEDNDETLADDGQNKTLTSREASIMELVKEGKTNRDIAIQLDISAFTVKNHLQHIYRKLGAYNRSQAVNKYVQR